MAGEIYLFRSVFFTTDTHSPGCLNNPEFQYLESVLLCGPLSSGTDQMCWSCSQHCCACAHSSGQPRAAASALGPQHLPYWECLWDLKQRCGTYCGEQGGEKKRKEKQFLTEIQVFSTWCPVFLFFECGVIAHQHFFKISVF